MVTEHQQFNGSFCVSIGKRRLFISTKNLDISFRMFVSVNRKSILVKRLVLAAGMKRSLRSRYRGHVLRTWTSSSIIGLKNGNSVMISSVPLSLVLEHPAQIRCKILLLLAYPWRLVSILRQCELVLI